ncbi:hypothetical protein jhhlp_002207 [Lomentospora prolificans]|uniref:PNPLA domain-containing protein n=1 Tax=Lomentospora prolificans TaxID=41688 RepID=A0A2N3NDB5_9PEZI|nr:hypothetical protein jhhlp_002207 [Lomentospora prolificans]
MGLGVHEPADRAEPVFLLSLGKIPAIVYAPQYRVLVTHVFQMAVVSEESRRLLIAIMLGRLRMSTQEVIDEYEDLSKKVFRKQNRRLDGSFRESVLESCIKETIKARNCGTRMVDLATETSKGLAFVVALRKGADENTPALFRTYDNCGEVRDCEIWQAARATTAAPVFFKPAAFVLEDGTESFVDGALKWNNPAKVVLNEAKSYFGEERRLGCLLSLGTGLRGRVLVPGAKGRFGFSYNIGELTRMASTFLTDPEPPHRDLKSQLAQYAGSYFRFSIPTSEQLGRVKIHDYKKMPALRRATEKYLKNPHVSVVIDDVVKALRVKHKHNIPLKAVCHAVSQSTSEEVLNHLIDRRKPSPIFTGRDHFLEQMSTFFSPRDPDTSPRRDFWLWGIGGVGKTQIALRFIELSADRFSRVFWIDASSQTTVVQSIRSIAGTIFSNQDEPPGPEQVISWLQTAEESWLLVVDNYDHGDISSYLPNETRGNIIFTSRRCDLPPKGPCMKHFKVLEMELDDSTTLLLRAASLDSEAQELRDEAQELVQKLGSLPLALDQAGSYIGVRGSSISEYLARLRKQHQNLLSNPIYQGAVSSNRGVYASFDLTVDDFVRASREKSITAPAYRSALQILNTFCFYHHEGLTFDIFALGYTSLQHRPLLRRLRSAADASTGAYSDTDPKESSSWTFLGISQESTYDPNLVGSGLEILMQYSLLRAETGKAPRTFSMHALIHSWARERMAATESQVYYRAASLILYSTVKWPATMHEERLYVRLLPHMRAVRAYDAEYGLGKSYESRINRDEKYAQILNRSGLWEEAISVQELVIKARMRELDANDASVLNSMLELGQHYKALGQWNKSGEIFLEVSERLALCPHREWAWIAFKRVYLELSVIYLYYLEFDSARRAAERVIAGSDKAVESHWFFALQAKKRLSLVHQYQLQWKEAEVVAEDVLSGYLEHNYDHFEILRARRELAFIQVQLGRAGAVERILADVTERFEAAFGKTHLEAVIAKSDLAWAFYKQQKFKDAEETLREVLSVARATLGSKHPYTLTVIFRLGLTLDKLGGIHEAARLVRESYNGRRVILMAGHLAAEGTGAHLVDILTKILEEQRKECPESQITDDEEEAKNWEEKAGSKLRPFAELPFSFIN